MDITQETMVTLISLAVSLMIQLIGWAYVAGRSSQMIELLKSEFKDHISEDERKHTYMVTKFENAEKNMYKEHEGIKIQLSQHQESITTLKGVVVDIKDAIRDLVSDLRGLMKEKSK